MMQSSSKEALAVRSGGNGEPLRVGNEQYHQVLAACFN